MLRSLPRCNLSIRIGANTRRIRVHGFRHNLIACRPENVFNAKDAHKLASCAPDDVGNDFISAVPQQSFDLGHSVCWIDDRNVAAGVLYGSFKGNRLGGGFRQLTGLD